MTVIHVERAQRIMDENQLDGLIAATPANIFYLTGIESVGYKLFPYEYSSFAVITRDNIIKPIFIVSKSLASQVFDGFRNIQETITYGNFYRIPPLENTELYQREDLLLELMALPAESSASVALSKALKSLNLSSARVGIDEINISDDFLQSLNASLPKTKLIPASKVFRSIRKVKTEAEIEKLRVVNAINEQAILKVISCAHVGIQEDELVRIYNLSITASGAEPVLALIRIGRNAAFGEILPDQSKLKQGDLIWFDVVCKYQGYWSDIARTACLGEPSPRAFALYQALLAGEQAAIEQANSAMNGEDLFNLTMRATRSHGIGHYERSHVGHGIGVEIYEHVYIAPGVEDILEEGTIVNIETPYYEIGLGALHIEDPFVINTDGNELLTTLDRSMLIIE